MKTRKNILSPHDWDLDYDINGELLLNEFRLSNLAKEYGTPLYILNTNRLFNLAKYFKQKAEQIFSGRAEVYYPFKCNAVPGVINTLKKAGLYAEVMTEYELDLALMLGFKRSQIIVNGPCKTMDFLTKCVLEKVKLIIVDSISELKSLQKITEDLNITTDILLRVNPDIIPKGLNRNSATGSKSSWFGFDLEGRDLKQAIQLLVDHRSIKFQGVHFHIGTGIRNPKAYSSTIKKLYPLFNQIRSNGLEIRILDVGGGFASMTSRELSAFELLATQVSHKYELKFGNQKFHSISDFLSEINMSVYKFFGEVQPILFFEPGRSITSSNQILLLTVQRIKEKQNKKWLITDGGLGTVTMPTYYEYHEIYLCNDVNRKKEEKVTITGPCCFASDIVYKSKLMPKVKEGEVLAIMDCGAYFNSLESSFNFLKPAILAVEKNSYSIIRRKETHNDLFIRDNLNYNSSGKENKNEIYSN